MVSAIAKSSRFPKLTHEKAKRRSTESVAVYGIRIGSVEYLRECDLYF
jgi:hypothetical protein